MLNIAKNVKYDGAYRWATITLTDHVAQIEVKESERVDKHYEFPGASKTQARTITPAVETAAVVKALAVAEERARTYYDAIAAS